MEDDTKIFKIMAIATCTLIATMGGCSAATNYQDNTAMVAMVSHGADPIDARCAIKGAEINACVVRAATKNRTP